MEEKLNKEDILRKISQLAKETERQRRDPRYRQTMGFLIAKGLLRTNEDIVPLPNARLAIRDAIWAGRKIEPRILEVLPAAVLRFGRHFDLDAEAHPELAEVVGALKRRETEGPEFEGIEFRKIKVWAEFQLPDKRVKSLDEKKIPKTYRLSPQSISRIRELSQEWKTSDTEAIERLIRNFKG